MCLNSSNLSHSKDFPICDPSVQKHKLSFSYVQKVWCKKHLFVTISKSYARLNALNTENVNARNPGSKFSFTIIESITCF